MHWLLSAGQRLHLPGLSAELTVQAALGSGSQGQVYAVVYGGQQLALKWYFPTTLQLDPELGARLDKAVSIGSPSPYFLWPLALVGDPYRAESGLGYLMPLRPPGYIAAQEHIAGRIALQLRTALRLCFQLAAGFHDLHSLGLCYKDISLSNVFLNPQTGSVLICDNDNISVDGQGASMVLGTPGFMAPEILRGEQRPCAATDLFSLAVLIFRLLTRHDPFRGSQELAFSCLDASNLQRLYGEEPVFIFDPDNPSNRPDPQHHLGVLLSWPIYPTLLHKSWMTTFGPGLHQPAKRVLTGEWKRVLASCLDRHQLCPVCSQETFSNGEGQQHCWNCGSALPAVPKLRTANGSELHLCEGNTLHTHHLQPHLGESLDAALGVCKPHPESPQRIGLQNCSEQTWHLELNDGSQRALAPRAHVDVSRLQRLQTPWGHASIAQPC